MRTGGRERWAGQDDLVSQRKERPEYHDSDFWNVYMPLNSLLFFADAGDGELFGYSVTRAGPVEDLVYVWDPITDDRTRVAESFRDWMVRWLSGAMSI